MDSLAARLGRSVAIDTPDLRLLAASRHFDDEDAVRVESLLSREMPPANYRYVMSFGVAKWTGPGRLQASEEFGAEARVCVPIRLHGLLLGFLWLIDADDDLTSQHLDLAEEATAEAAIVLYRSRILQER